MTVRARFVPSLTGVLHLGSDRTALFSGCTLDGMAGDLFCELRIRIANALPKKMFMHLLTAWHGWDWPRMEVRFFRPYALIDILRLPSNGSPTAAKKHLCPAILEPLTAVRDALVESKRWSRELVTKAIKDAADGFELNMGNLGQRIRVAVTGGVVSPPIDVTLWLVGRNRLVERLDRSIQFIERRVSGAAA